MRQFTNACKAERLKLFTTRSWWVLIIVMVTFIGFTAAITSLAFTEVAGSELGGELGGFSPTGMIYSLGSAMGYLFPVLLGALSVTAEYRHHTMTPTFIASGRRGDVLGAKATVQGLAGAGYGVIATLTAVLGGVFFFMAKGMPTGLAETSTWLMFLRGVVIMAVWGIIGVGLGALIRSQAGAIVLVIAFTQFVEPIARMAGAFNQTAASVTQFLPGAASDAFVGESIYATMTEGGVSSRLLWWQGGLVLATYAVVLLAVAWLTRWRSDVS